MDSPENLYHRVKRFVDYRIEYQGVNLLSLSQIFVFELSLGRLEGKGTLNRLKRYSLENYVKAILSIFSGNRSKVKNSRYLFVNDVFNGSMVQNMRAIQDEFGEDYTELIADKRLVSDKSKLIYRYFGLRTFIKQVIEVRSLIKRNDVILEKLCAEFNIKKRLVVFNILDSLFVFNCASNFLKSHPNTTDIVLNTDVHKLSKALVLLSKDKGIKAYVNQHGATVLEYGYLPVISDYMLSWGKLSNDWFIERGTHPDRLVATGTPKMDDFVNYQLEDAKLGDVHSILLILNPVGDNSVMSLLRLIKEAELDRNYNLKVKLHPGSVDNRDLVESIFNHAEVEIIKHANTHDLIHQSDVVITTTSTVGNETIAFQKPLVQIKIEDVSASMEYENRDCSHVVVTPQELNALLMDTTKLESKKINYPQFIEDYFYSLDGKSAKRISNFIQHKK